MPRARDRPERIGLYLIRGNAWLQKKDYDAAIGDDANAIRLAPNYAHAYACRGPGVGAEKSSKSKLATLRGPSSSTPRTPSFASFARDWGAGTSCATIADYDDEAVRSSDEP